MRISDFIEQSNQTSSPEALLALMERAADDLGFDKYAYCALTCHNLYDAVDNPAPAVAHNFPTAWIDYYFENNYQTKDPVVLYSPQLEDPFLWDDLDGVYGLDQAQQTVMQQADEAGLKDGAGVPLHGPRGNTCLLTFATGDGHPHPAAELPKLGVLATQFHSAYKAVGRAKIDQALVADLSGRELECLRWIAVGKTSWEIGEILTISQNTVNFHVKNLLLKLDANNRIAAVVEAYRCGLISLDSRSLPT